MLRLHPLVIASLFCGAPVSAETFPLEIDEIFSWTDPQSPGCSVAVQRSDGTILEKGYGSADLEQDQPITPDTVFDAGSVQKQFVAAAILLLEQDGRLTLLDDVRKHIPELPDYGFPITIDHLLTHTSGLRDWTALEIFVGEDIGILDMILAQRTLNFAPGEEWSYSNSNYVLLKQIVERTSGQRLAGFTKERLFAPLGMAGTAFVHDLSAPMDNRALGYADHGGTWVADMRLEDDRGGGVLFTTAADLLKWNDALSHDRLGSDISDRLEERARLNNGRVIGYGRGLMIDSVNGEPRLIWHSGGAGGYSAIGARFLQEEVSLAILCNAGERAEVTRFSRAILDALFGKDTGLFATEVSPAADEAGARQDLAGLFVSVDGQRHLRLVVENGLLQVAGGPVLVPNGEDSFRLRQTSLWFMSEDDPVIRVRSPDELEFTSLEGQTVRYLRAPAFEPDAAQLAAYAGRYSNPDMDAVIEVIAMGSALFARLPHLPPPGAPLMPAAPDMFQFGPVTVVFARNGAGHAGALSLTLPALRNLVFEREPRQP